MNKAEIKNKILSLGSDHVVTFGGNYEGGINLQQVPDEITELIYYLLPEKDRYKNFIEIGAAAGGNTKLFDIFFNFENITIADDNKHPKHYLRKDILKDVKYNEYIGDSQSKEANKYVRELGIKYDIMIIDADHTYGGVKNDTYNFLEFLNKNGILIFHDTIVSEYASWMGVDKWCMEIKNEKLLGLEFIMYIGNANVLPRCGLGIFKKT